MASELQEELRVGFPHDIRSGEVLDRLEHFLLVLIPQQVHLLHVAECSPPSPPGWLRISLRNRGQIKAFGSLSLAENISLKTTIVLSEFAQPLIFQCLERLKTSCFSGSVLEGNEGIFTS